MNTLIDTKSTHLNVTLKEQKIERDITRVICRQHMPSGDPEHIKRITRRITRLSTQKTKELVDQTLSNFSHRHENLRATLYNHFNNILGYISLEKSTLSEDQKLLIGAYFTMEYAVESAALFNPSIVPHPDQNQLSDGSLRFIMSLRAVGEGHISSLVFRSGTIDKEGNLEFNPISPYADTPEVNLHPKYDRHLFRLKLNEMGSFDQVTHHILEQLPEHFAFHQLEEQILSLSEKPQFNVKQQVNCFDAMHRLANSNYQIQFQENHSLSERVIFPVSEEERGGIEDARFVKFTGDNNKNGSPVYYALYTAYNGETIMPQLIETHDFKRFKINTLNGKAVQNKNMTLFPRKINGQYAMLSRQDGENNHIMFSDHLHFWQESTIIQEPCKPWEFIKIGNCGPPIETNRGWLVLTHGVGPMRSYSIGAILLDLDDPTQLIARLKEPILRPREEEREGYVPNVVYTCGSILHQGQLIIPYAMSDIRTGIAHLELDELLDAMIRV